MKKEGSNEVIKKSAKPWRRFVFTLTLTILAIVVVKVDPAISQRKPFGYTILIPHFESVGIISANGLSVEATYNYGCTPDEGMPLFDTTVTQESTLSLARIDDLTQGQCTGDIRTHVVDLTLAGGTSFLVRKITKNGKFKGITGFSGYCQSITLVKELP